LPGVPERLQVRLRDVEVIGLLVAIDE